MLKVFGKDYVCHDKAARLKAWAGAHSERDEAEGHHAVDLPSGFSVYW